jgi:FAD/FMN-containing dehydrogenase
MVNSLDANDRHVDWALLAKTLGNRLLRVTDPFAECRIDPTGARCRAVLSLHHNPFAVEEHPAGFHTTGWHGAFGDSTPQYVVAAESSDDVAAVVDFAHANGLQIAIKGTGHDYLGRSRARGELLIWTHRLRRVTAHESFSTAGAPTGPDLRQPEGVPALTVAAGARWLEAYRALEGTRQVVSGGGCNTVGAAGGFTLGGGFSSFSRLLGTAAGNVLEMEVVTADGSVLVVNDHQHPDLFWALRGGGGGTFGVVTKVTYATHVAPDALGGVSANIRASSDRTYRALVEAVVDRLPELATEHWGEQVRFGPDNSVEVTLTYVGLTDERARGVWQPLFDWVEFRPRDYATDAFVASGPFDGYWDAAHWLDVFPDMIRVDERPGPSHAGDFWWTSHENDVSQFVNSYQSRWLPLEVVRDRPGETTEALYQASRYHPFGIHLNKGLAGAAANAVTRDRQTSVNPAVFSALGLVICVSLQHFRYPGVPGHAPDPGAAAVGAESVTQAMAAIRSLSPHSGSYVNESDFFEEDWGRSYWGDHYPRLLEIKRRYDPDNAFSVHHGVGTE